MVSSAPRAFLTQEGEDAGRELCCARDRRSLARAGKALAAMFPFYLPDILYDLCWCFPGTSVGSELIAKRLRTSGSWSNNLCSQGGLRLACHVHPVVNNICSGSTADRQCSDFRATYLVREQALP